jgi:hypothetical protein
MLRWGNYDTVSASAQWIASEVPTGLSQYANPVPSDHALPDSLYLSRKPAWFIMKSGAVTWPAIGPDITGGQDATGHVYKIPAHVCYDITPKTNGILNFNSSLCYPNSTLLPASPKNLRIIR